MMNRVVQRADRAQMGGFYVYGSDNPASLGYLRGHAEMSTYELRTAALAQVFSIDQGLLDAPRQGIRSKLWPGRVHVRAPKNARKRALRALQNALAGSMRKQSFRNSRA